MPKGRPRNRPLWNRVERLHRKYRRDFPGFDRQIISRVAAELSVPAPTVRYIVRTLARERNVSEK